jgi:hypothetical protein
MIKLNFGKNKNMNITYNVKNQRQKVQLILSLTALERITQVNQGEDLQVRVSKKRSKQSYIKSVPCAQ